MRIAEPPEPLAPQREIQVDLLSALLVEQQSTAVERFARWHDAAEDRSNGHYRGLIPLELPQAGEQYAFEVDLDACSGCKACVAACHNLNGLEENETWRNVGLLHGGDREMAVLQHVTSACHHCLEPACLEGCPVEAYEKDPITGIVRHLDDQCIGCQYCILKCPYDVPQYSRAKGIVRKCDMCSDRLATGEAPACVQACPNEAIRISIVDREQVAQSAEANLFLPGAPEPRHTLPTTVYRTKRGLPTNLLPADYYSARPQHAHLPLVFMLVLTQMSVGALAVGQLLAGLALDAFAASPEARMFEVGSAFVLGMTGLAASVFHLGRPWLAYRAVMGWRTSWLSREVLAFGLFALLACIYAALHLVEGALASRNPRWQHGLGAAVVLAGLSGVFCSTMIYASTRRPFWNAGYTAIKFLLTAVVLGIPVAMLVRLAATMLAGLAAGGWLASPAARALWTALAVAMAAKLVAESLVFTWLRSRTLTPLRRTALLMCGDLRRATAWRFLLAIAGGIVLPLAVLVLGPNNLAMAALLLIVLAALTAGEIIERYLFFAAVVAPKMPGAPAA